MKNGFFTVKRNTDNRILSIFALGLIFLLAIRDIGGVEINKFIYLVYILLFITFTKKEIMVYIFCFMFPLMWGLPGTYILLASVILYNIKCHKINKKVIVLALFFMFLEIISSLYNIKINSVGIIQYLSTIILFFTLLYENSGINYKKAITLYLIGTLVLCVILSITTLKTAPSNWLDLFSKGWFRFGDVHVNEESGMLLKLNPNNLAYQCVLGISIALVLLKNSTKYKLLLWCSIVVFLLVGILSTSRTFIFVLLVIMFLMIWYSTKSIKTFCFSFVSLLVIIAGLMWYLQKNPFILEGLLTRFSDKTISSGGGRIEIFTNYMTFFFNNPRVWFLGTGVTQYTDITKLESIHNALQQLLVCLGIPGMLIFLFGMLQPLGKCKGTELLYWIPVVSCLIFVQANQFINPSIICLMYIPAFYALKLGKNQ